MLFLRYCSLSLLLGLVTSIVLASGLANAEPTEFTTVSPIQLKLDLVTSSTVCGSTLSSPTSRICLGDSANESSNANEVSANDTIQNLKYFLLGGGNHCGVDDRGIRCWATSGKFEKPIQEILSKGDTRRAQLSDGRICLPQTDQSIHCYFSKRTVWHPAQPGESQPDVSKVEIPPKQIFGPYKDLRFFQAADRGLCVVDGDTVKCESYKDGSNDPDVLRAPKKQLRGAKSLAIGWDIVCVLSEDGLDCLRNSRGASEEDGVSFHLEGQWKTATQILAHSYDEVCGADKSNQPFCVKLGEKSDDVTDETPREFIQPGIRFLKFQGTAERICALTENNSTKVRSLLCGTTASLEELPFGVDAVNFTVGSTGICTLGSDKIVHCFDGKMNIDSPLPEDGSISYSAGRCRWNDSRFHCASTDVATDFTDIKKVVSSDRRSVSYSLPCFIYENRTGLRLVKCFGARESLSTEAPSLEPENVLISATGEYACAYGGPNTQCWGRPNTTIQPPNLSLAKKILFSESPVSGGEISCSSDQFGFVCWGFDFESRELNTPSGLGDTDSVSDFAVGYDHICVIDRDKHIQCWGNNAVGQLKVPQLTNPTSIAASGYTTCASSDEGITCWGQRFEGLSGVSNENPLRENSNE